MMLNALRWGPAAGGPPTALIVLLHGIGADGQDLIGLAKPLSRSLPHAVFAAPDAPHLTDSGFGRQWFVRDAWLPSKSIPSERAADAAGSLNGFLDAELARNGLAADRLGILGFSQGAMMALHVGLQREPAPAAIVACSGALPGADRFAETEHNHAPVLLIHGEADDVVPIARLAEAAAALRRGGVPLDTLSRRGLGHSIDGDGVLAAAKFFARFF